MIILEGKFLKVDRLKTINKITVATKEEINKLTEIQLIGVSGFFAFSGDQIKKQVEDGMKNTNLGVDDNGKSPSQKFRGLCFQIALENNIDAEEYYLQEMKKIQDHYKKKLI